MHFYFCRILFSFSVLVKSISEMSYVELDVKPYLSQSDVFHLLWLCGVQ